MKPEQAKIYVKDYDRFVDTYGEERVNRILDGFPVSDFQSRQTTRNPNKQMDGMAAMFQRMGYEKIAEGMRTFTETKNEWEREVKDYGMDWIIPCPYQNRASELHKQLIYDAAPYIREFAVDVYKPDGVKHNDFYVRCESMKGSSAGISLYVPCRAIIENDKQLIIDRHTSYHKEYYGAPGKEKYLKDALSLLESKEAKYLFEILDKLRDGGTHQSPPVNISNEYMIPIAWSLTGFVKVNAESKEEAAKKLRQAIKDGKVKDYQIKDRREIEGSMQALNIHLMDPELSYEVKTELPDGRVLKAAQKTDPDYPGIQITLEWENEEGKAMEDIIAWAEYNMGRSSTGKDSYKDKDRLRIMAWSSAQDEPEINMGYDTAEFECDKQCKASYGKLCAFTEQCDRKRKEPK